MPAQCWLHPTGEEHDASLLVGVRMDDDLVYPADVRYARGVPEERHVPASWIDAEVIRS